MHVCMHVPHRVHGSISALTACRRDDACALSCEPLQVTGAHRRAHVHAGGDAVVAPTGAHARTRLCWWLCLEGSRYRLGYHCCNEVVTPTIIVDLDPISRRLRVLHSQASFPAVGLEHGCW